MTFDVERIDVTGLDTDLAGRLATIDNAALAEVPLRRHTGETFRLDARDHGGEGPYQALWLARTGGRLVGYSALHHNAYENLNGAKILGAVHPDHQRQGLGRALLQAAEAATDRPKLRVPTWRGTPGEAAVPRMGYSPQGSHEVRRLSPRDPQPAAVLEAAAAADRYYDLERFVGACPEAQLGEMQLLREAINDAPEGGDFEEYPPDRMRRYEESLAGQAQTPYTVVARHRATGEAAGLTLVCVPELRPAIAAQEDTSVLRAHRGHRLGLRMKLEMLAWLRAERPEVESIDTWNAPDNAPMIAINQALGCRKVAEVTRFTKLR